MRISLGRLFWIVVAGILLFATYREFGRDAVDGVPRPHVDSVDLK